MSESVSRRRFLRFAVRTGGLGVAGSLAGVTTRDVATAAEDLVPLEPAPRSPREALARLMAGNRRWLNGEPRHPHQAVSRASTPASRRSCCSTRVSATSSSSGPRGRLVDDVTLGSVEFGPDELRVPLVFLLGHERCGAVTAAITAIRQHHGRAPGHIQHVVDALRPAYTLAVRQPTRKGGDLVDNMGRAQTRLTVAQLRRDHLLAERLRRGALGVVGGRYDLDTGRVEVIA